MSSQSPSNTSPAMPFGASSSWLCSLDASSIVASQTGPAPLADLSTGIASACRMPCDFPALGEALIPDDRVVIVLNHRVPSREVIVKELWQILAERGIAPAQLTIIDAPSLSKPSTDPRSLLPAGIASEVQWQIHQPADPNGAGYLGSSLGGERIYLSRALLDADFIIPVATVEADPVHGLCGAIHAIFPALTNLESLQRLNKASHEELHAEDERPIRQLAEEVAGMLGLQFSIELVPAAGGIGVAQVLAGQPDAVHRLGRQAIREHWLLNVDRRSETVVAAVTGQAGQPCTWEDVSRAAQNARRLVINGGRVVLLTDLSAELTEGWELVRDCTQPRDAIRRVKTVQPVDEISIDQMLRTADFATVYLLGGPEGDILEELFLHPLASLKEVDRLLEGTTDCILLGGAQYVRGKARQAQTHVEE